MTDQISADLNVPLDLSKDGEGVYPAPKRLRIQHVLVQPVLVWDDGDELTPGPDMAQVAVPVSKLIEVALSMPDQLTQLAEQLATQDNG